MKIPLEQGFTVVTGPNGSGKSNILDGVLFCLGLATSRGMRADRLTDLVNSGVLKAGKAAETIVSVRFDLSDWQPDEAENGLEPSNEGPWIQNNQQEWIVTRKLRVMPGGSYSSNYFSDGEPCNLQQLQTQFRRLRIDPEGSNVVMQGDVTRIVSMSNKDRRGLIDELAGVALFDSRIEQTRSKLDDVQERQDRCRIVEQELIVSKQKLQKDCEKAKVYQALKEQLQLGKKQELVLAFEEAERQLGDLKLRYEELGKKEISDLDLIKISEKKLLSSVEKLTGLQTQVKELGEDQLLSIQAEIAGLDTQVRELERQALMHKQEGQEFQDQRKNLINKFNQLEEEKQKVSSSLNSDHLQEADLDCKNAEAAVETARRRLADVAGKSGEWAKDHRERAFARQKLNAELQPLYEKKQNIEETLLQLKVRSEELEADQERDVSENKKVHEHLASLDQQWKKLLLDIKETQNQEKILLEEISIQERTRNRMEDEQVKLEKDIARLESRRETIRESRGTGALKLLLDSGLDGIHGLVANLGEVEDIYRQALEVAAGGRLGQIVVDNDRTAAKAIELLKRKKAGRLTFLPLNKINQNRSSSLNKAISRPSKIDSSNQNQGLIGRAFDLIKFESIYSNVFEYVFGETLVFKDLASARIQLGIKRSVTLEGELLDKNGAMTGGSFSTRGMGLSFGLTKDGDELEPMRLRLLNLGETLAKCLTEEAKLQKALTDIRSHLFTLTQSQVSLDAQINSYESSNAPLVENQNTRAKRLKDFHENKVIQKTNLDKVIEEIKPFSLELEKLDKQEHLDSQDSNSENWKQLQADLELADSSLEKARINREKLLNEERQYQYSLERFKDQKASLIVEENRLKSSIESLAKAHQLWREQNQEITAKKRDLEIEQKKLETRFGEQRRERDLVEADVANQRQALQESQWKLERLRDERLSMDEEIRNNTIRLKGLEDKLPDPLPLISDSLRNNGLEFLQNELENLQRKMESLEPVNMLALEELGKLEKRLEDLCQRLEVLSDERAELLLRIETVSTLRQEAFMEAFEAVDIHFREIFAQLSEGDGHLQLENKDQPLEGGLTLVAHPKGKSVRRLAAMSGGEKSLTALSFLFALQRFRPSPFYALDEVDSFLDGVNVERLSSLIAKQAMEAQFLVVSHRRPMIGASTRTIGVTQARGSHTQVIGLPIAA